MSEHLTQKKQSIEQQRVRIAGEKYRSASRSNQYTHNAAVGSPQYIIRMYRKGVFTFPVSLVGKQSLAFTGKMKMLSMDFGQQSSQKKR